MARTARPAALQTSPSTHPASASNPPATADSMTKDVFLDAMNMTPVTTKDGLTGGADYIVNGDGRTHADVGRQVSSARTAILIAIFCFAQFVEISSGASVIPVLGAIARALDVAANDVQWVLSAYALSFAAFMLLAGRISDLYSARYVFSAGFIWAGCFSLAAGFAKSPVPLFILRALQGLGAAFSIPPAIRLIVILTPDRKKQGYALQLFALAGGSAATFSSLIGGGIATSVRYEWVFWFIAIAAIPTSILAFFLTPAYLDTTTVQARKASHRERVAQIDVPGALLVALSLILFVFALTEGNRVGWGKARTLAPLILSVAVVLPAFLLWEEFGRTRRGYEACLPLAMWRMDNFAILFVATTASFYFYGSVYITFTTLWSEAYLYSPWQQAKYFLPIGIATMLQAGPTPLIVEKVGAKPFLSCSSLLAASGSVILANASLESQYWHRVVPGQVLIGMGAGMIYICCSQALIQTGSPIMSGVLGAIWTSGLQFGLVLSIAICLALVTAFDHTTMTDFAGYRAAFYSMTVVGGVLAVLVILFLKPEKLRRLEVPENAQDTQSIEMPDTPRK